MTITDQFPGCADAETVNGNMDERSPSPDPQENLKFPFIHTQKRDPLRIRAYDQADYQALRPDFHPRWAQAQLALAVLLWGIVIVIVWWWSSGWMAS
jgi:hypothetical protein